MSFSATASAHRPAPDTGPLEDLEQLRVTVSSGAKSVAGFIKRYTRDALTYRLSLEECSASVTVSFDWANTGADESRIQTEAHVWGVHYECDDSDQTNRAGASGRLFDAQGAELNLSDAE